MASACGMGVRSSHTQKLPESRAVKLRVPPDKGHCQTTTTPSTLCGLSLLRPKAPLSDNYNSQNRLWPQHFRQRPPASDSVGHQNSRREGLRFPEPLAAGGASQASGGRVATGCQSSELWCRVPQNVRILGSQYHFVDSRMF